MGAEEGRVRVILFGHFRQLVHAFLAGVPWEVGEDEGHFGFLDWIEEGYHFGLSVGWRDAQGNVVVNVQTSIKVLRQSRHAEQNL